MQKQMIERKIDKVQIPKNCLDVLAQQIFGFAIQRVWKIEDMLKLIKRSYCYKDLSRDDFLNVISYLSGEYALEARNVYAKIWYDPVSQEIGKRGKLARVIYMTNIGTIPDESFINVVLGRGDKKGAVIGKIDESFLERLKPRDVFVLGGQRYEFQYTRGMNAYVSGSVHRPPTIPSWASEMLPLSFDLALEIQRFRRFIEEKLKAKKSPLEIKEFIKEFCYTSDSIANEIYSYMKQQSDYIDIPHDKQIIIERYSGEKKYYIFHSLFGRRVNDALSRAIGFLVARLGGRDVELGISDNGFYLAGEDINVEKALKHLNPENVEEILKEAIEKTEVLKRRFRHCAARSLMILRSYKGRTKSVGKQQMHSGFLLGSVRKLTKNFPILKEARREVLEDLMDIENTKKVLSWIKSGDLKIKNVETKIPSPFSLGLIIQGYADLIKIEDKLAFLRRMHKLIDGEIEGRK